MGGGLQSAMEQSLPVCSDARCIVVERYLAQPGIIASLLERTLKQRNLRSCWSLENLRLKTRRMTLTCALLRHRSPWPASKGFLHDSETLARDASSVARRQQSQKLRSGSSCKSCASVETLTSFQDFASASR